jgi:hypothetical protein
MPNCEFGYPNIWVYLRDFISYFHIWRLSFFVVFHDSDSGCTTVTLGKEYEKKSDIELLKANSALIEQNLEALGFTARIAEVNTYKAYDEFYVEVAVGTDLNKLEKHGRELAMALKSPTGKIQWRIPVPGTYYVGIRLPKPSPNIKHEELMRLQIMDWRSKSAVILYTIGEAFFLLSRKILGY